MKAVLVANMKGGVGKTLIATTLAAALAARGGRVALADADRQRSALRWVERRPGGVAPVEALDWTRKSGIGDAPDGLDYLVIDAPGSLRGAEAEALFRAADLALAPVQPAMVDLDALTRFLGKVESYKRVRKGAVEIHLVANRIRNGTRASRALEAGLAGLGQAPLARLTERAVYAELAGRGLSVFDRPIRALDAVRAEWAPLLGAATEPSS